MRCTTAASLQKASATTCRPVAQHGSQPLAPVQCTATPPGTAWRVQFGLHLPLLCYIVRNRTESNRSCIGDVDGFELEPELPAARRHGRAGELRHRREATAGVPPVGARRQVLAQVGRPCREVRAELRRAADVLPREREGDGGRGGLAGEGE